MAVSPENEFFPPGTCHSLPPNPRRGTTDSGLPFGEQAPQNI